MKRSPAWERTPACRGWGCRTSAAPKASTEWCSARREASGSPSRPRSFRSRRDMGESWDPDLVRQAAGVEGYEARFITQTAKYDRQILMLWGPQSDLARDPRWGRSEEVYGEDPFLNGTMAAAFIKGLAGRRSEVLAIGRAAQAFSGQQQRESSRQLVLRLSTSGCSGSTTRFPSAWAFWRAAPRP